MTSSPSYDIDEPPTAAEIRPRATLKGHLSILRVDHWFKNVFVIPGFVVALSAIPGAASSLDRRSLMVRAVLGLASVCLVASSNYTINELLDAKFDRLHPIKHTRPVPAGLVSPPLAVVQWLVVMLVGLGLAWCVNTGFLWTMATLWLAGCAYNIAPIRTKDLPYVDVLSESLNNPLRMLAGWYIVAPPVTPPASLLAAYWMIGAYFMAMKRYAEYRMIADPARAAAYRSSFAYYDEQRLLTSIMFYAAASMLFLGAFTMRYRVELVLAFPLVALVLAQYMAIGQLADSPAQRPEALYKQPRLMITVVSASVALVLLLLVDLPWVDAALAPMRPMQTHH